MLWVYLKYILQSVAGMLGLSAYILADTFFISVKSGPDGLAILNIILPVYGLIYGLGSMIGLGSATRFGLYRTDNASDSSYFSNSIEWNLIISIPFVISGVFFPERILSLLGSDQYLAGLGKNYLRVILLASPLFMCNYSFTAFSRNSDAAFIAMVASFAGSLFNIIFDYVFMFVMDLGFTGAAIATALSPAVTMAVCSIQYIRGNDAMEFRLIRPSAKHLKASCALGVSAFTGEMSSAVITLLFNAILLHLAGNTGVAAYGIIANISAVAMAVFNGVAQGSQPLISRSYREGDKHQVHLYLLYSIAICLILESLIIFLVFAFTDRIIGLFSREGDYEFIGYAYSGLRLYFLGFIAAGINTAVISYFSAVNKAVPAAVGSALRGFISISICALLLSAVFGIYGLWLSFLCSESTAFFSMMAVSHLEGRRFLSSHSFISLK